MTIENSNPPIINAPTVLIGLSVIIIASQFAFEFGPESLRTLMFYEGATIPKRFWATYGFGVAEYLAYPNIPLTIPSLFSSAFLHGDWFHLVFNLVLLVSAGKPVHIVLKRTNPVWVNIHVLFLFFISVAGGSLAYLVLQFPDGVPAIGASGGVSGVLGALFYIKSRLPGAGGIGEFLKVTVAFIVVNIAMVPMAPALLGSGIAWEAHIGGYVVGTLYVFAVVGWRQSP